MKNKYITVRPTVEDGESLTSYLFRIAELNGKKMIDIWYEFHKTHKKCHNPKCEESLEKKFELVKEIEYIQKQDYLIKEWKYLLDPTKQLTDIYAELQLEQSLAIKVLYLLQTKANVYIRKNIKILSPVLVKSLASLIRGTSTIKKVFITDLFQIIRGLGIGLEEFSNTVVPNSYIESFFEKKEVLGSGNCLAEWCSSYNSNIHMDKINNRVEPRKTGLRYSNYFVCLSCFMRYGYHPKLNQWQEIDGKIKLNNEVTQLASLSLTKCQISNELEINFYKISEIFGYLAQYQCFEKAVLSEYTPLNTPMNLIECFDMLECNNLAHLEKKYKEAKVLFNWTLTEFSYYYADPIIQKYYLYKPSTLKKPLQKYINLDLVAEEKAIEMIKTELNISLKQVAIASNCLERTLQTHGLGELVERVKEKQKSYKLDNEERELRRNFDKLIAEYLGNKNTF